MSRLLVPRRFCALPASRSSALRFGFYYTLEQITGQRASLPQLVHDLVKLKRSEVIRCIANLSMRTAGSQPLTWERQAPIAGQFLEEELFVKVRAFAEQPDNDNGVLFQGRSLWFMLQMTVVACREDTQPCDSQTLSWAIGRCCLMANDILDQIESLQQQPEPETDDERDRWTVSSLLPLMEVRHHTELLARSYLLWFDIPQDQTVQRQARHLGLPSGFDGPFTEKYGLPLSEFFLILLGCYSSFGKAMAKGLLPLFQPRLALSKGFSPEVIDWAMRLLSQTPDELSIALLGKPRQTWALDLMPIMRRPLLEVMPGHLACPDLSALYRVFADGIYWLLHDAFADSRRDFRPFFGHVFGRYVERLIEQFTCPSSVLARMFYPSPTIQGTTDEACDGLIDWGPTVVLMEYKAGLLTNHQKYGGDMKATMSGIEGMLAKNAEHDRKGAGQLAATLVSVLLRGETIACGDDAVDLWSCRTILPVIVAYEEAFGLHAVRNIVERRFRSFLSASGVDDPRIGPLLILTAYDLEVLEVVRHHSKDGVESLLCQYAAYVKANPGDRVGGLHSFLYTKLPNLGSGDSYVEQTFGRVIDEACAKLKARWDSAEVPEQDAHAASDGRS
jgi:hypothetical protein